MNRSVTCLIDGGRVAVDLADPNVALASANVRLDAWSIMSTEVDATKEVKSQSIKPIIDLVAYRAWSFNGEP